MRVILTASIISVCMLFPIISNGFDYSKVFDMSDKLKKINKSLQQNNSQPKQRKMNKSSSFAVQGCVAGSVGGALVSNLMGKSARKNRQVAAIGCLAGGVVGYKVGKRTQQYANENQALQRETTRNKRLTGELNKVNKKLLVNIADYKLQIASIRRSQLSQQEKRTYLQKTKNIVVRQRNQSKIILRDINQDIVIARNNLKRHSAKAPPQKRKYWQNTIVRLERERSILNRNVHQLTAIGNSI